MEILYCDDRVVVCIKPPHVLSTDEPGGMPDLLRQALGRPDACVRTVHRLDQVVGGLMVFARTKRAAGDLSRQIRQNQFEKEYLAVVHGIPVPACGTMRDLLLRCKQERKTCVVQQPGKDVQEAILHYQTLATAQGMSLVRIQLVTGRTHQIRAQFSARGLPLAGDRKYARQIGGDPDWEIALWSHRVKFDHPRTGEPMEFTQLPPRSAPWDLLIK